MGNDKTQEALLSSLVVAAHTIEKGLTMPFKKGVFGLDKARQIVDGCNKYISCDYDIKQPRFCYVVGIMQEYSKFINENGGGVKDIVSDIDMLCQRVPCVEEVHQLYDIKLSEYFSSINRNFADFARSRHSLRNLSGAVDEQRVHDAISLAMTAPSTCNRQSIRIHVLKSEESKRKILELQSGNRGFGDNINQFILITSDLNDWPGMHQRNAPYVDGGIFLMNLLYSLHFHRIGACTLNLYLDTVREKSLHDLLNIPNCEVPIAVVGIGIPPEKFDIALSKRRNYTEVMNIQ